MGLISLLKKLPLDFGQANLRTTTKGKLIALNLVNDAHPGQTALDVGCREGYQTKWLQAKGYTVTSIDIEKNYELCQVVDCNKQLPFSENSFDLIWCSEVIEHLYDPAKVAAEFRRVLKPGGVMILTTPNSYFWLIRPVYWFGLTPKKLQNPDHKHFFTVNDIRKIFPKANLYGFFPYMFLKFRIKKFLGPLSPTFVIHEKVNISSLSGSISYPYSNS